MANNVFANGRELSCKSGSGKAIACLPDVCMTPPENPATPPGVPVPYPNTGMASDNTSGSRNVKITKKEVSIKNSSYFKKSSGDEAGSAAKKGVVSSKNRGKVYFTAWSMDVMVEGENAVRHLDMTTHNHGSPMNAAPQVFQDGTGGGGAEAEHECQNGSSLPPDQQCPGTSHTLRCNAIYCDGCIDQRDEKCQGEADAEQAAYDRNRARDPQHQAQSNVAEQTNKAWDEIDANLGANPGQGPMFEVQVTQAYQERDDAQQYGFKAHCTVCHVLIEIDIVTDTHIMEIKSSSRGFNLQQMQKYQTALDQCPELAGKRIGLIAPGDTDRDCHNIRATANNFGAHGIQAQPFALQNGGIVAL